MSGLISYSELQQSAPLPVAIDYPAALALRQMALIQGKLPKYLLAPEVSALHHYVPDLHRRMLLATLWNTYICINEALALTLSDFSLVPPCAACHAQRGLRSNRTKTYGKRKIIV